MAKRVYFAFHYKDVAEFRANVVRNHNFVGGVEKAGYFDASIWEEARNTNPLALKRLINSELENTSVTVVLIGSDTWGRPWVRYEILKSMKRGNKLLGIHINGIPGKDQQTKDLGPNPFDFLGKRYNDSGTRLTMLEQIDGAWSEYTDIDDSATYQLKNPQPQKSGQAFTLSNDYPVYLWNRDKGYENFSSWIE
jgi:hypothetical protein